MTLGWEAMKPIRIYIVDDNPEFIYAVILYLTVEKDFLVVGYSHTGHHAVKNIPKIKPDLVLLDFVMPDLDGCKVAKYLKSIDNEPVIIMFSMHDELVYIQAAKESGADAFLSKMDFSDRFVQKLDKLYCDLRNKSKDSEGSTIEDILS
jgi:DNA-binding NarL/FixJ family response regulator